MIEPARRRRVSCTQENKLFTPPPSTSKRWQKPFKPRFGEGGGWSRRWRRRRRRSLGNLCVTCPDMPKSATCLWRLHSQGTWLHFFFFLKASAGLTWKNKAGSELNDVALGKKGWCDYITPPPPTSSHGGRWRVLLLGRCWALLKKKWPWAVQQREETACCFR